MACSTIGGRFSDPKEHELGFVHPIRSSRAPKTPCATAFGKYLDGGDLHYCMEAICTMLPKSAARLPMQRQGGRCLVHVEAAVVDGMRAMRGPGEDYSDVILCLAQLEASGELGFPALGARKESASRYRARLYVRSRFATMSATRRQNATRRFHLGKAGENLADGADDSLIGMEADLIPCVISDLPPPRISDEHAK